MAGWPSLTRSLDSSASPVRTFVDALLADRAALRELRADYTERAGPQVVPSFGGNAGTIGTAADFLFRFLLVNHPDMRLAAQGAARLSGAHFAALVDLVRLVGGAVLEPIRDGEVAAAGAERRTEPLETDVATLARACWVFALFTEVFRVGGLAPGSPLAQVGPADIDPDSLLAIASENEVDELVAFSDTAAEALCATVSAMPEPWFVGPTFAASALMPADADLVAGGTLIELKTNLGAKQKDGSRQAELTLSTLRQLVAYVLHDTDDRFELDGLAVYDARYRYFRRWDLRHLLDAMAGRQVDLPAERLRWSGMLALGPDQGRD